MACYTAHVSARIESYDELRHNLARFGMPENAQQELTALLRALGDPNGAYAPSRTPEAVTPMSFREFVRAELLPKLQPFSEAVPVTR